jgi:hypothetical protein
VRIAYQIAVRARCSSAAENYAREDFPDHLRLTQLNENPTQYLRQSYQEQKQKENRS